MKIDDAEPSSSSSGSDMPPASATLLRNIVATKNDEDFIAAINKGREVHAVMGKTELYKWTEVLNRCDEILEKAVHKVQTLVILMQFLFFFCYRTSLETCNAITTPFSRTMPSPSSDSQCSCSNAPLQDAFTKVSTGSWHFSKVQIWICSPKFSVCSK